MKRMLQYVSDLHVDRMAVGSIPRLNILSNNILICGDIGSPKHQNFSLFCSYLKNEYEKVFFVPGNHEYDTSSCYCPNKVEEYKPYLLEILDKYNINNLDCKYFNLDSDTIIAGCTLWSNPRNIYKVDETRFNQHKTLHTNEVNWIKELVKLDSNKKIIMGTHFCPSPKLIEPKFYVNNKPSDWFHTNLEHIMVNPIIGWFAGHSHSNIKTKINNIECAISAYHRDKINSDVFLY